MILSNFRCPIDNLPMMTGNTNPMQGHPNEDEEAGAGINKHIHRVAYYDLTCVQGHVWTAQGEIYLARTA